MPSFPVVTSCYRGADYREGCNQLTDSLGAHVRDPYEWMREQERRTEELLAKAERAKSALAENIVSHASPDKSVQLTVNPGGGLDSLELGPTAQGMQPAKLSALIMRTYREATTKAADRTLEIVSEFGGPNSETVDFIRSTLPPREEPEGDAQPPSPARADDDDDFDDVDWTNRR